MKAYFQRHTAYNRWANAQLYQAALALDETDYRHNVGAFFKSMHGTPNHLLLTDRIWLKRLTGQGDHPNRLNAIAYEDRLALASARANEDDRLIAYVDALDDAALVGLHADGLGQKWVGGTQFIALNSPHAVVSTRADGACSALPLATPTMAGRSSRSWMT
ncbi:MAG: hypothetical protein EXQ92_08280 [Alphaproteobacteria bacterium]|nr:hypothetical protein [Alphaproteobacteria bacterium]